MCSIVFGFLFKDFPAGLTLYWTMYNIFSVIEQTWLIVIRNRFPIVSCPMKSAPAESFRPARNAPAPGNEPSINHRVKALSMSLVRSAFVLACFSLLLPVAVLGQTAVEEPKLDYSYCRFDSTTIALMNQYVRPRFSPDWSPTECIRDSCLST